MNKYFNQNITLKCIYLKDKACFEGFFFFPDDKSDKFIPENDQLKENIFCAQLLSHVLLFAIPMNL